MSALATVRSDFLVSVCLVEEEANALELDAIEALAGQLALRFRYWEIIYVIGDRSRPTMGVAAKRIARIKNLRIIVVNDQTNFYRRRVIAASEAIGDAVVIAAFDELELADPCAFLLEAFETDAVLLARRSEVLFWPRLGHALLNAISTHRVNPQDLKTIASPRTKLNAILAQPTAALDLRYEPRRGAQAYKRRPVKARRTFGRAPSVGRRWELLGELVANSTPRFLRGYAAFAAVVALLGALYAVYAVFVELTFDYVEPGWFSTSIVQSGSVVFIAGGFMILCLGAAELAERQRGRDPYAITAEINNIDFFEHTNEMNVEIVPGRSVDGRS